VPAGTDLGPRAALLLGGLGIALFAVLGAAYAEAKDGGPIPTWFRSVPVGLNGEWTLPALYSALLLLAASALCFRAAWLVTTSGRFTPLVVLGVLFAYMGVDEFLSVHERLEHVVLLSWWKFYAPVAVVAGVAVLLTLRRIWPVAAARSALLAGCACWLLSQLIETQQYDGTELVHRWTILPEEVLEMTGSLLFVVALLALIGATVTEHQAEPAPS
jgi:hypothetical protein